MTPARKQNGIWLADRLGLLLLVWAVLCSGQARADAAEVRKYVNVDTYYVRNKDALEAQLLLMAHSELLKNIKMPVRQKMARNPREWRT